MPAQDPLSQVFSALADPLRRDVVARLTAGDLTVGELAAPYEVTPQAVSKHLRVLEAAGLVSRRREAQRRPVHLEAEVFDLMTMWIERHRREAEFRYRPLAEVLLADGTDEANGAPAGAGRVPAPAAPRPRRDPRLAAYDPPPVAPAPPVSAPPRPEPPAPEPPAPEPPAPEPPAPEPRPLAPAAAAPPAPVRVDRLVVEERDTEPRALRVRRGQDRVFQPWDLHAQAYRAATARSGDAPEDPGPAGPATDEAPGDDGARDAGSER